MKYKKTDLTNLDMSRTKTEEKVRNGSHKGR